MINYQFCLYLLNNINIYKLDLQKLEKINFLLENFNISKINKCNTYYYKLYLFYAYLIIFLKLYKTTDNF